MSNTEIAEFKERTNKEVEELLAPVEKEMHEIEELHKRRTKQSLDIINQQDKNGDSVLHRSMREIVKAIESVNMYGVGNNHQIPKKFRQQTVQIIRRGGNMFLSNKEGITPIDILVVNIQHLDSQREQQNPRKDVRYYESIFQAKSIEDKVQTLGCFLCDILKQRQVGGLNKKLKQRLASNLPDNIYQKLPCHCKLPVSKRCYVKDVMYHDPVYGRVSA